MHSCVLSHERELFVQFNCSGQRSGQRGDPVTLKRNEVSKTRESFDDTKSQDNKEDRILEPADRHGTRLIISGAWIIGRIGVLIAILWDNDYPAKASKYDDDAVHGNCCKEGLQA